MTFGHWPRPELLLWVFPLPRMTRCFSPLCLPGLGNQQLTLSLGGAASEPVVLTLLGQAKSFSWPKATFFQVRGIPRTEIFLNYSLLEKGDKHIQEVYK